MCGWFQGKRKKHYSLEVPLFRDTPMFRYVSRIGEHDEPLECETTNCLRTLQKNGIVTPNLWVHYPFLGGRMLTSQKVLLRSQILKATASNWSRRSLEWNSTTLSNRQKPPWAVPEIGTPLFARQANRNSHKQAELRTFWKEKDPSTSRKVAAPQDQSSGK